MDMHSEPWEWLNRAQDRGVRPGLERMERLLAALGNPQQSLRCLHVAGTNGKGSVCAFAESLLRAGGYRTGFYSSPHLVNFTERIRLDGVPCFRAEIEEGICRLQKACDGWDEGELPTYFELVTAVAFDLFARADCDIIVLETGLGGRLDATNTAPKIACAITPIAMDHAEWLGESLTSIAREKAGILRPKIPAVVAPQCDEVTLALLSMAKEMDAPISFVNEPLAGNLRLGMAGSHQRRNAALALELVKAGGYRLSENEIRKGLAAVSWPGRFQILRGGELILDGAHNLHAVRQLVETWHEEYGGRKCRLIFGALLDKNPSAMLSVLESVAEEIILVPVASPRSMNAAALTRHLRVPNAVCESVKEALEKAFVRPDKLKSKLHPADRSPVLLAGSLFLVGEALALESGRVSPPRSQ